MFQGVPQGTPVDLEGPQRAAMSPTRTPSGTGDGQFATITSLEGLGGSIGTATTLMRPLLSEQPRVTGGSEAD